MSTNHTILNCDFCKQDYLKYTPPSFKIKKNNFCSIKCKSLGMKGKFTGIDNPNFGNYWTEEQRNNQSDKIKSLVDDQYRLNSAKAMKGKTIDDDTKNKRKSTILERYGNFLSIHHTDETKKLIGEKSKLKFTEEYKANHYEVMVNLGNWISREDKEPYHFYKMISNWNYNVFEYNVLGQDLYETFGYFNRKNKDGVVRDHRFSRYSGFKLNVFPEILQHPFNCEMLKHSENIKKHHSKTINSDSITLNELFDGILNYDKLYKNQDICVALIQSYKDGERYNIINYLNKH